MVDAVEELLLVDLFVAGLNSHRMFVAEVFSALQLKITSPFSGVVVLLGPCIILGRLICSENIVHVIS